jgi:DNA-binding PadR family transcriptional regulator
MNISGFGITNLAKNCNEALILAILFEGKKHGYQLALEIEEKSEGYFKFNHGTLYPILHKLEKEGFIKGTWKQEGPKRKRKYYTLTSGGKKYGGEQLAEWLKFFNHFLDIVGEIKR